MKPNRHLNGSGQRVLRLGRRSEPGRIYHVTTATRLRRPVFQTLGCARALIQELRTSDHRGYTNTLAFVIMPDHLHWLFELTGTGSLEQVVNQVKGRSSLAIGQSGYEGRIWQTGFFDHALRKDEDTRVVSRYIVANPLRAGLTKDIRTYPHWDAVWLTGSL